MAIDANGMRHCGQGFGEHDAKARTAHVNMDLRGLGAILVLVRLQRQVQKDISAALAGLLRQHAGRGAARQERERHGAGQLQSALTVCEVVAEVIDNDGDSRCVGERGRRETQQEPKQ